MIHLLRIAKLASLACLIAAAVHAEETQEGPKANLQATVDEVLNRIYGEGAVPADQRTAAVREAVGGIFSFKTIARGALGRGYRQFSESQFEKFTDSFTDLLVDTYSKRYEGDEPPEISWGRTERLGSNRMEVYSTVTIGDSPAEVVYRLAKLDGRWRVYDIVAEGVSLVGNYREQFRAILNKEGPEGLLDQINN
jgi:phospholipid transport system substrate-binding protein